MIYSITILTFANIKIIFYIIFQKSTEKGIQNGLRIIISLPSRVKQIKTKTAVAQMHKMSVNIFFSILSLNF